MSDTDLPDTDMMVRAAWLYYLAELTQNEVAGIFGVSRVKVARLIGDARAAGLINIEIDHRLATTCKMEEALRSHFGLQFCFVTPPLGPEVLNASDIERADAAARRGVGMTGARLLRTMLSQEPGEKVIGLAWGRTISAMADAFRPINDGNAQFVSLLGSLTRSASANPFDVVQKLAMKTGGEAKYLPVPFIADSEEDREVFWQQRVVQDVVQTAMRAKACFISVGECDDNAFLSRYGYLSADDLALLKSRGAVGDTLGLFFDRTGAYIDAPQRRRTLAIDLQTLSHSTIVLMSAGLSKINATEAILKAGFISGLLIDGDSAAVLYDRITTEATNDTAYPEA